MEEGICLARYICAFVDELVGLQMPKEKTNFTPVRWVLLAGLTIGCGTVLLFLWQTLEGLKAIGTAPVPELVIQQSPVRIVSSSDPHIFPSSWHTKQIRANAKVLDKSEVERTRQILNRAIRKYPQHILATNLRMVYVLSELDYLGITASGTNSRRDIYLKNRGVLEGFTDAWIEETFHHELALILLRNYPQYLDRDAWKKNNPPAFEYVEGAVEAVKQNHADLILNPSLCVQGFLCEYSQSSLEMDFTTIAQHLFLGDAEFRSAMEEYAKLKAKRDLVIAFYEHLDPKLDESFFASLSQR